MSTHGTTTYQALSYLAVEKINAIQNDAKTSSTYKAIALIHEAADICVWKDRHPPEASQTTDLFFQDPYKLCVNYYTKILEAGRCRGNGFKPTENIKFNGEDTCVLQQAYKMKKKYKKIIPGMRKFEKLLRENFPKETDQADFIDEITEAFNKTKRISLKPKKQQKQDTWTTRKDAYLYI